MSELPEYIIDRLFDAPRALVWRAWTDPELIKRWYGPSADTTIHKFDLKPGGVWLNEMSWGERSDYQKVVFQEVVEPEKLVWHHYSSTDANWNSTANAMMPDWPHLLLTTVTFADLGAQTNVRLSQTPMEATEAEIACFTDMMANMDGGWGSGYKIMDNLLEELQAT